VVIFIIIIIIITDDNTVDIFKLQLDKFWKDQDMYYDTSHVT